MCLTDLIKPKITELGKIKIGGKSATERTSATGAKWRAPEKYDHFIITTLQRDARSDLVRDTELMAQLGKSADSDGFLRQLPIAVLSNEIEDIMQASFVWYSGKKVAARSDGKELTTFLDTKTKQWLAEPIKSDWKAEYTNLRDASGNKIFKLHTIFNCVIAASHSKWGGFYRFRTTSEITAGQLYGSLLHLKELTGGILRGLPLRLAIRPMQVSPMVKGVPTPSTVYVVHVELLGSDLNEIQQRALEQAKWELSHEKQLEATRIEYKRLLAAPGTFETDYEHSDIAEEFAPEENGAPEAPATPDPLADALGFGNGTEPERKPDEAPEVEEPVIPLDQI